MAKLIKMVRHKEGFTAPYEAQVHPKEVANYAAAGWVKVVSPKKAAAKKAAIKKTAAIKAAAKK